MTEKDLAQAQEPAEEARPRRRFLVTYGLPALVFAVIAAAMGYGLLYLDPRSLPSALIDKPVPDFSLPPLPDRRRGLDSDDLHGQVSIVNVFASWCAPCKVEHPVLMQIAADYEEDVKIFGIAYKDRPADTVKWLEELGDPYNAIGVDRTGRVSIDFGVYGVPETYVVRPDGSIAYRHVGPITQQDWNRVIAPLVKTLQREAYRQGS
ncbi:DsbE family thiol:disulfide interchange protein [Marinibaculum pumilum]|uniref:DsbE family thiol:disulfide interchange protein n=1 Tax=Marinibaculum pumilum TaxID=1766165 RepID=A0ABV7KY67_9PROT